MAIGKFVNANGLRLHYLDYGGEGKPALLCIHGLTGNAHNFDPFAPRLTAAYHVMSLDVRGRGESQWGPAMEYTLASYVSDLAATLDQLDLMKVTLVGTSMGGIVSIAYAGGYPERVEKLVINDIGPEIDAAGATRIGAYVTQAQSEFSDLSEVAAHYRQNYPSLAKLAEPALLEFARWSVKPSPSGRLTWKMDPAVRTGLRGGAATRAPDLWMPYTRITAPILIVRGAESDVLSKATAQRMCRVLKNVRLVEVPGVGHAPSLVEPESIGAIREFLGVPS
jgi:pimeloyl-ACP methyl ester carboxylesterase